MKRLPLKLILLFVLAVFVLICIADISLTLTLNRYSQTLKRFLSVATELDATFKYVNFSILGGIKFNQLSLRKGDEELLTVQTLNIKPSLLQLIKGKIGVRKIILRNAEIRVRALREDNILFTNIKRLGHKGLGKFAGQTTKTDLRNAQIVIKNLKISSDVHLSGEDFVLVNAKIKLRRENLFCLASLDFSHSHFNETMMRNFLLYKFSKKIIARIHLAFMKDDLLVNNAVFSSDNVKVSGAGIVYDFKTSPVMDIKFISIPLNLRETLDLKSKIAINGLVDIAANLTGGLEGISLHTEMMMHRGEFQLPRGFLRLSNVFCNMQFKDNSLIIKELSGVLNLRYPFSLQGRIYNLLQPEFNIRIESIKSGQTDAITQQSTAFILQITAKLIADGFVGDGNLSFILEKKRPHYLSKREVAFNLINLTASFKKVQEPGQKEDYSLNLKAKELSVLRQESLNEDLKNSQQLRLNNLIALLWVNPEGSLRVELYGDAYQGKIAARSRWGLHNIRPADFLTVKFIDLSVADLKGILPIYADVSGRLNGFLYTGSSPLSGLNGALSVTEGRISKLNLIDAIADFLRIKSVKELDNVFLATDFSILGATGQIKRFILRNERISLNSSLQVNENEWVSGLVHITLPKNVLEESNIMHRLLSMVGERGRQIEMDFRVSGFPQALRVELLEGEFRKKLIKGLSSGIREQIESEINKAIDSLQSDASR